MDSPIKLISLISTIHNETLFLSQKHIGILLSPSLCLSVKVKNCNGSYNSVSLYETLFLSQKHRDP